MADSKQAITPLTTRKVQIFSNQSSLLTRAKARMTRSKLVSPLRQFTRRRRKEAAMKKQSLAIQSPFQPVKDVEYFSSESSEGEELSLKPSHGSASKLRWADNPSSSFESLLPALVTEATSGDPDALLKANNQVASSSVTKKALENKEDSLRTSDRGKKVTTEESLEQQKQRQLDRTILQGAFRDPTHATVASLTFPQLKLLVDDVIRARQGGNSQSSLMYAKPYTRRIDNLSLPDGYQPPKFQKFNGKGNPRQHVAHFVETCNNVGTYGDLMVKQFVQSLEDAAFECTKRTVSLPELANTKQKKDESVTAFIERWRYLVLNCREKIKLATRAHDLEIQIARHDNFLPTDTCDKKESRKDVKKEVKPLKAKETMAVITVPVKISRQKPKPNPKQALKCPEEVGRVNDPKYCKYHRIVSHPIGSAATNVAMVSFGSFSPVPLLPVQPTPLMVQLKEFAPHLPKGAIQVKFQTDDEEKIAYAYPSMPMFGGSSSLSLYDLMTVNLEDWESSSESADEFNHKGGGVIQEPHYHPSNKIIHFFQLCQLHQKIKNNVRDIFSDEEVSVNITSFKIENEPSFKEEAEGSKSQSNDPEVDGSIEKWKQLPSDLQLSKALQLSWDTCLALVQAMPLYVSGIVRDHKVNRILIDDGSAVNIMPIYIMKKIEITIDELTSSKLLIQGFNQKGQRAIGKIRINFQIANMATLALLHVIEAKTLYELLLRRTWVDENGVKEPFTKEESHFADAKFYEKEEDGFEALPIKMPQIKQKNDEKIVVHPIKDPFSSFEVHLSVEDVKVLKEDFVLPLFALSKLGISNPVIKEMVETTIEHEKQPQRWFDPRAQMLLKRAGFKEGESQQLGDLNSILTGTPQLQVSALERIQQENIRVSVFERLGPAPSLLTIQENHSQKPSVFSRLGAKQQNNKKASKGQKIQKNKNKSLQRKKYQWRRKDVLNGQEISKPSVQEVKAVESNHVSIEKISNFDSSDEEPNPALEAFEEGGQAITDELKQRNLGTEDDPRPIFLSASLSLEEEVRYVQLLTEYKDVVAWSYKEMPGLDSKVAVHRLAVKHRVCPVKQLQRHFCPNLIPQIEAKVDKLIEAGFIREVHYPSWIANIVPVHKKNRQLRACVDFRDLNQAWPKDDFPLPIIELMVDATMGHEVLSLMVDATMWHEVLSFMDGFSSYNQIRMDPKDEELTTFRTPKDVWMEMNQFQVVEEAHSRICGVHQFGPKLHYRIRRMGYYWLTMVKDCMEYAKKCEACHFHATFIHQPLEPLHPTIASWPFHAWGLDVIGPITPKSLAGHAYILAATDYFSKWVEAVPLRQVKKENVFDFIRFKFAQHFSSTYNAAVNGLAEAFNKTLCNILKKIVPKSKRDWHERIGEALWAYRTTHRTPTKATPYSLVFGVEVVLPLECQIPSLRIGIQEGLTDEQNAKLYLQELEALDEKRLETQQHLECYQARLSRAFNKKVQLRAFQVGNVKLAVRRPIIITRHLGGKFTSKWDGPYIVTKVYSKVKTPFWSLNYCTNLDLVLELKKSLIWSLLFTIFTPIWSFCQISTYVSCYLMGNDDM
ncbi:hypothetical protein SLEP1_g25561 [Rubroshorea leprosula]|uniref:Uncharacterized protein n=1 Tax=Rubroshorea leprosula TaxID=152421 RepID=A0AAV5JPT5_9ROSI|nr:hypothetical protein SLEP1_g25561 [Rubroshorea leprosula]